MEVGEPSDTQPPALDFIISVVVVVIILILSVLWSPVHLPPAAPHLHMILLSPLQRLCVVLFDGPGGLDLGLALLLH